MAWSCSVPFLHPALLGLAVIGGSLPAFVGIKSNRASVLVAAALAAGIGILLGTVPLWGSLKVSAYAAALTCGFAIAWIWARSHAWTIALPCRVVDRLAVLSLIAGIIGSRGKWLIDFWPSWSLDVRGQRLPVGQMFAIALDFDGGGAVLYGGLILATLGGIFLAWRHRIRLSCLADLASPSVLIGIACGRVGCFLNGCCWGNETSLPWSVAPSPQAIAAGVPSHAHLHPTVLYEAIFAALFAYVLHRLWRTIWAGQLFHERPARAGDVALAAVVGYASWRLAIEALRDDTQRQVMQSWFGLVSLTSSQGVSVCALLLVVMGYAVVSLRRRSFAAKPLDQRSGHPARLRA